MKLSGDFWNLILMQSIIYDQLLFRPLLCLDLTLLELHQKRENVLELDLFFQILL